MQASSRRPRAFFLYRDSAIRRRALAAGATAGERYSLYGLDEVAAAGLEVAHNLEAEREPGTLARAADRILRLLVRGLGGYAGDFATVLACRRELNRADVVFSTVDTVGIPLALLARAGLVRSPVVYAAIGLPERLEQLRSPLARRLYAHAFRRLHTVVAYSTREADVLRGWLGSERVVFLPFGVDTAYFRPGSERPTVDVVSVGADPRRDYRLLLEVARRRPNWSFVAIASRDHAGVLAAAPASVAVRYDVPTAEVRDALQAARVVALPVRENTYSGATTALLQALACGKPVVVSQTAAVAEGYGLEDGVNCALVPPGDAATLEAAIAALLEDEERAAAFGAEARRAAEQLSWRRYAGTICELLLAASRTTVPA